ncbi:MAG: HD domain-containing protein, partial [Gemmatimonadetes bacterium]
LDPDGVLLDLDAVVLGASLLDIGKLAVPDAVLNKPEPLTDEEWALVRRHPRTGRQILEPLTDDEVVLSIVSWHHERWDGSGYPDALAQDATPLGARLVAVCDVLAAMTSERAYRRAMPWEAAVEAVRSGFGSLFDPGLAEPFAAALERLRAVHLEATGGDG